MNLKRGVGIDHHKVEKVHLPALLQKVREQGGKHALDSIGKSI